jgi:hypothetical protein
MGEVEIEGFLAALVSVAQPVEIYFGWRPQLRAPPTNWCCKLR